MLLHAVAMARVDLVPVVYVHPFHAKLLKTELELTNELSKTYRMVKVDSDSFSYSLDYSLDETQDCSSAIEIKKSKYSRLYFVANNNENYFQNTEHSIQQSDGGIISTNNTLEGPTGHEELSSAEVDFPESQPLEVIQTTLPLVAIPVAHTVIWPDNDVTPNNETLRSREALTRLHRWIQRSCHSKWARHIVGWGQYPCSLSSSAASGKRRGDMIARATNLKSCSEWSLDIDDNSTLFLKQCLYQSAINFHRGKERKNPINQNEKNIHLWEKIQKASTKFCPNLQMHALERLGKDTILLPSGAFHFPTCAEKAEAETRPKESELLVIEYILNAADEASFTTVANNFQHHLYQTIIRRLQSRLNKHIKRLARKCEIDPNSPIRESRCDLLYHDDYPSLTPGELCSMYQTEKDKSITGAFENSPGWISITEHGIRQSFDFTKIMFSRGNVTEKLRFGSECVQRNDVVLDMYAGIGYYTLPAMILGHAKCVYACEWNSDAVGALKKNIKMNGLRCISTKNLDATDYHQDGFVRVLQGDCRVTCEIENIINCVDRISLGLLPSSEGGWHTAVKALRYDKGGWLHVHGNVPTEERTTWAIWLCFRLLQYHNNDLINREKTAICDELISNCSREKAVAPHDSWNAICQKVVKVKSFAPRIDHVVADVFLGPFDVYCCQKGAATPEVCDHAPKKGDVGGAIFTLEGSRLVEHNSMPPSPSCALNSSGVLHQSWMM